MHNQSNPGGHPAPDDMAKSLTIQAIKVKAHAGTLSPAQRRFNKLMSRLDHLNREMQSFEHMMQQHRMPFLQLMKTIHESMDQYRREMVLFLHDRRQGKALTATEKKIAADVIKFFFEWIEESDDEALESIFNIYHSAKERAQQDAAEALIKKEFLDLMESMAGQPVEGLDKAQSPEEMMAIFSAHLDAKNSMEAEGKSAQVSSKKPSKKRSARQLQEQQAQEDAHTTMRMIFRQLASALHPDREPDPAERERKTALMSQANAAYERRDLSALLRLQMQMAQIDEQSLAKLTDDKLNAMSTLLKEQVATLEQSKIQAEYQATHEFGFDVFPGLSEPALLQKIRHESQLYQDDLAMLQSEIVRTKDPAYLKQWLKDQKHFLKQRKQKNAALGHWGADFF
jgi:hypothetical protein